MTSGQAARKTVVGACMALAAVTASGAMASPVDGAAELQVALAPPVAPPAGSAKAKPGIPHARAEIIVLHATNDKKGIDPKIGKLPELQKPPFSAYDSYRLLDRAEIDLTQGQAGKLKLPDDGQLAVTLNEIVEPTKKGDPIRFGVGASIQKPGGRTFLPGVTVNAKKGEIFFLAGQTYQKGILVIGIRVLG